MAKLTTTFTKIPTSMGAKVLVGGKKKTAGSTSVGKLYKTTFIGINRYGSTLASVGNQIGSATEKLNKTNEKLEGFEKKRKTLNDLKSGYLDLVTKNQEDITSPKKPSSSRKPGTDNADDTKAVKKEGRGFLKAFGFLGKLLGGLKGFLGKAFFTAVLLSALKWFGDPANAKKVDNIVKGLKGVFGFVANVAKVVGGLVAGGIINLGSGLEKIFSSGGDPKQILSGFGDLLQAIPGLFTIAWILKPGLMIKAVMKILNGFREPRERQDDGPDKKKKKDPKKPDQPKAKKKSWFERQKQKLEIQRKKLSKKFARVSESVGEGITSARKGATEFVSEQGKRIRNTAGAVAEGTSENWKKLQSFAEGLTQAGKKRWGAFVEGVGDNWKKLTKAYNSTIGALSNKFDELAQSGGKRLMAWLAEQKGILGFIGKNAPGLFAKIGKYLPFVGDVVGFVMDIMNGIDWRRALIRAVVGAGIDAGFTALMAALGLATPFTGGASGIAATALYLAYMGADLAVGGLGVLVGDPIADALGIPMKAGEDPNAEKVKPKTGSGGDVEAAKKAVAAKDPDFAAKIAEKDQSNPNLKPYKPEQAEDGGILSPEGKQPLPFGAATTSENRDDIRDLIGFGASFNNKSVRGLLIAAIKQQKLFADTTYNMKEKGIFETGIKGFLQSAGNMITGGLRGAKRALVDNFGHLNPFRTKAVAAPNDNARALLDMIAHAEGADYNVMFTGKKFDNGYKDHPRQIQVSGGYRSDAAGRYQFLSTTWDGVKGKIGAKDFSPANQDKGALQLAVWRGVDPNKPLEEKDIYRLGGEWASLEGGPNMVKGGSYGSQAKYSAEQALKLYKNYGGGKDLEEKDAGGEVGADGQPSTSDMRVRLEKSRQVLEEMGYSMFAGGGELDKLNFAKGAKKGYAPGGYCVTGVINTGEANGAKIGDPEVAGGIDRNNPRGLMAWAVKKGYGSVPGTAGTNRLIKGAMGDFTVTSMTETQWADAVIDGLIPSGALIFNTRHGWDYSGGSSGNDAAIAQDGGAWLWSGHEQSSFVHKGKQVGAVYSDVKEIVALTHPGGNTAKFDGAVSGPGGTSPGGTSPGGSQTVAKKPVDPFKQLTEAIAKYKSIMGGGTSTTTSPTDQNAPATEGMTSIGPVADGDAYAKALENTNHGEGEEKKSAGGPLKQLSAGGEFSPMVDRARRVQDSSNQVVNMFSMMVSRKESMKPSQVRELYPVVNTLSKQISGMGDDIDLINSRNVMLAGKLMEASANVVASKKSRARGGVKIINSNTTTRQQVVTGTNSYAIPQSKVHTKFF